MTKFKKLFSKLIPTSKTAFRKFDNVPVKNLPKMKKDKNFMNAVTNALKNHKKAIGVTVVATATTAAAVTWIENYITSNSGCFLMSDDSVCKMKNLSCCQPDPVENLSFCNFSVINPNVCQGYVDDSSKSCCLQCNCIDQACLPGQTMECRRPTVGQALSHLSDNVMSTVWDWTSPIWNAIYSWFLWIIGIIGIIFVGWIAWVLFKKMSK